MTPWQLMTPGGYATCNNRDFVNLCCCGVSERIELQQCISGKVNLLRYVNNQKEPKTKDNFTEHCLWNAHFKNKCYTKMNYSYPKVHLKKCITKINFTAGSVYLQLVSYKLTNNEWSRMVKYQTKLFFWFFFAEKGGITAL